jgi:hypothetical protein
MGANSILSSQFPINLFYVLLAMSFPRLRPFPWPNPPLTGIGPSHFRHFSDGPPAHRQCSLTLKALEVCRQISEMIYGKINIEYYWIKDKIIYAFLPYHFGQNCARQRVIVSEVFMDQITNAHACQTHPAALCPVHPFPVGFISSAVPASLSASFPSTVQITFALGSTHFGDSPVENGEKWSHLTGR